MKKSFKKIAATMLAATMTMGLAVSAFGAEIGTVWLLCSAFWTLHPLTPFPLSLGGYPG